MSRETFWYGLLEACAGVQKKGVCVPAPTHNPSLGLLWDQVSMTQWAEGSRSYRGEDGIPNTW